MSDCFIKDSTLSGWADAIRDKTGKSEKIKTSDMADEISGIDDVLLEHKTTQSNASNSLKLIKDSTITAIADAIREKDGTTDKILGSDIEARIRAITTRNYLTFTAEEANSTVTIAFASGSFEYKVKGKSWTAGSNSGTTVTLESVGDYVKLRGTNCKTSSSYHFAMTGKVAGINDMTCLVNEVGGDCSINDSQFAYAFHSCTSLTSAPDLPATSINSSCYSYMFYGCTALTSAPDLPATSINSSCYSYMFYGCTSLTTAPSLPATTLANSCYSYMFYSCTSLATAPSLPASTPATSCYYYMFSQCSSITQMPSMQLNNLSGGCCGGMFYNCTKLTSVALAFNGATMYQASIMFGSCTSLKTVTINCSYCYSSFESAFLGCTSLSYVKMYIHQPGMSNLYTTMFANDTQSDLTIACNWSEGQIDGAPWGATNATILYNVT